MSSLKMRRTDAVNQTIVSPALPVISHYFRSSSGYTWIGTAYLLSNAASTPLWGRASDIWGRKPVLLAAVATFFVGSLLCAAARSIGMLIAGRAVQGSAAGGIVILVNICVSDLFDIR
jgi:MFS family permease